MPAKKREMSFEQSEAVHRNLSKAQAALRAQYAARAANRELQVQREREAAKAAALEAAKPRAPQLGETVTGRSTFDRGVYHTGTVTDLRDAGVVLDETYVVRYEFLSWDGEQL